jgi:hypothetical protein
MGSHVIINTLLLHVVFENVSSYFSHATSMYGVHFAFLVRGFPRPGVCLGEKIAVYYEKHNKHINVLVGENTGF